MKSQRRIKRHEPSPAAIAALPDTLSPVLRRIYAARGLSAESLDTGLARMIPVSQLEGTAAAADRLSQARNSQERVLVIGDFDADGATATAVMLTCMRAFGFKYADYLVPDRFKYGYGLSAAIVEEAATRKPDLIITVDNGITSISGVDAANQCGIDVIVTDHHLPGASLPAAAVIVNPNSPGSEFPSKALAGVGVAFYVMAALGQRLAGEGLITASVARAVCASCLDLVALGTVADLVPLDQNNRILVTQGLARIRGGNTRPGIAALFEVAGRNPTFAVTSDIGFGIAPRLNAAGRLEDMALGIECLLASNKEKAQKLAATLSQLNDERRDLQSSMQKEAEVHLAKLLDNLDDLSPSGVCLYDPGWHQGVVGLVATRIKDMVNRPVFAFASGDDPDELKGSGRSVRGVHLRDLLANIDARNPGLLGRFGGHAMAAGLSLSKSKLDIFREAFLREAESLVGQIGDGLELISDGSLQPNEFRLQDAETLRSAAPWGQSFPEPVFDGLFTVISQRIVGGKHLKLELSPAGESIRIEAIAFNHAELLSAGLKSECRAAYRLDVNEFRGIRRPQLVVEHIESV